VVLPTECELPCAAINQEEPTEEGSEQLINQEHFVRCGQQETVGHCK
jgi:hypothetical protein